MLAAEPPWGEPLPALIRLLVAAGADLNAQDQKGESALMKAAKQGHAALVALLLAAGANRELRDKRGKTALSKAMKNRHMDVARLLLGRE